MLGHLSNFFRGCSFSFLVVFYVILFHVNGNGFISVKNLEKKLFAIPLRRLLVRSERGRTKKMIKVS